MVYGTICQTLTPFKKIPFLRQSMIKFRRKDVGKTMDNYKDFDELFEYDHSVLKTTNKKEYLDMAYTFWTEYGPTFESFAMEAISSDKPLSDAINDLVAYILDLAEAHLPKTAIKSKRHMQNMDDALFMVTFVFPSLVSYNDIDLGVNQAALPENVDITQVKKCFRDLAFALASSWGARFKVEALGVATTLEIANAYGDYILKKDFTRIRNFFRKKKD